MRGSVRECTGPRLRLLLVCYDISNAMMEPTNTSTARLDVPEPSTSILVSRRTCPREPPSDPCSAGNYGTFAHNLATGATYQLCELFAFVKGLGILSRFLTTRTVLVVKV
jgi:hypothetical protein